MEEAMTNPRAADFKLVAEAITCLESYESGRNGLQHWKQARAALERIVQGECCFSHRDYPVSCSDCAALRAEILKEGE